MFNLMTYDLHGASWDWKTGHNAPLGKGPKDTGTDAMLNVVSTKKEYHLLDFYIVLHLYY